MDPATDAQDDKIVNLREAKRTAALQTSKA
jgi:hypothetical protein